MKELLLIFADLVYHLFSIHFFWQKLTIHWRAGEKREPSSFLLTTSTRSRILMKFTNFLRQDLKTLTSQTLFKSQVKNGFRKTVLAEPAKYISTIIYLSRIIYYLFTQLICNHSFIYLFVYILYSGLQLALYSRIELFFTVSYLYFLF